MCTVITRTFTDSLHGSHLCFKRGTTKHYCQRKTFILVWNDMRFFLGGGGFYSKLWRCHTSSYFIITHWEREKVQCRLAATHSHIHAATFSRKWKRHQPESTTTPCVSLQHVDVAALLIKYNACVNATDKWAFTPLHEAAQKGRTQLCALLLEHGADPTLRNQEGQSPLDLVTVVTLCVCLLDKSPRGKKIFLLLVFCLSTIPFSFCNSDAVKPSQSKPLLIIPGRLISYCIMS